MGIMLNEDCNHFIYTRKNIIETVDKKYLQQFIDQYKDTMVTDFIMNISATLSFVPSRVLQFAADKYLAKEEMGKPVDYSDTELASAYHLWYEKNIDMYEIWIERCRHNGINPWLSIRMNDAEVVNIPNHLMSEYYYEHFTDYAVVRHREPENPREYCRDYEIDDYRNKQLEYIKEMLGRYDVFGLELDFQREPFCLQTGREWDGSSVITDFMLNVKKIVNEAELKWGHKIKISVRTHAYPEDSRELGFDVVCWAKSGLVDVVIPSPNYLTTDNSIPLYLWKDMLGVYGVEVVGCIERHINSNIEYMDIILKNYEKDGLRRHSFETLCASAAVMLSQVPDKIYLFNYMDCPKTMTGKWTYTVEDYEKIMRTVGNLDAVMKLPRRHIVTYKDTTLNWKKFDGILPLTFEHRQTKYIKIPTGKTANGMKYILRLGIKNYCENTDVFVNSVRVSCYKTTECEEPILTDSILYCYKIPFEAIQSHVQVAEITAENMTVDYADIMISD